MFTKYQLPQEEKIISYEVMNEDSILLEVRLASFLYLSPGSFLISVIVNDC